MEPSLIEWPVGREKLVAVTFGRYINADGALLFGEHRREMRSCTGGVKDKLDLQPASAFNANAITSSDPYV